MKLNGFYISYKMTYKNFIIIVLFTFFTCCSENKKILPNSITLVKELSINAYPYNITLYKLSNFDLELIIKYDFICFGNNNIVQWQYFDNLNYEDKEYIRLIIYEKFNFDKNKIINNLYDKTKNKEELLFSGCYKETKKLPSGFYKFFDTMNFIDIKNKKLYSFKHIN